MLKKVPYLAVALALPLSAFALHAPQNVPGAARTTPAPSATIPADPAPLDHAINTKGTGATNGRVAPSPTPTPQPVVPCRDPGPCPRPS